jgi:Tfp pilus assembly protein PilV
MTRKTKNHLKQQRGIAMIVALLALVLLAAIGTALMFMADTENSVNNNYKDSQKAYFAARAGAEQVRLLLATDTATKNAAMGLTMPNAAGPSGIIYLLNPASGAEAIDPTSKAGTTVANNPNLDDQLCWEKYPLMAMTPPAGYAGPCSGALLLPPATPATFPSQNIAASTPGALTSTTLPYKWVRITNKQNFMGPLNQRVDSSVSVALDGQQICWDGSTQVVSASATPCQNQSPVLMPVWELTSLAVTPPLGNAPGSRRMVQMEVAFAPPLVPPAPISVQAPVNLQGSYVLNAYDNCTCTCVTPKNGPAVCTSKGAAACNGSAHAVYTQNTVSVTGGAGSTITSYGTDPTQSASVQSVNPWPNSLNVNNLINHYKAGAQSPSFASSCSGTANFTAKPPTYLNCGTQTSQSFGDYPSGLPTEPAIGSYQSVTEYIPGSVKLTSAASGSGILIVDGDLEINGGLNWYGLILVRGKVSFTGGAGQSTNLYGSILAGDDVSATNQAQTDNFGGSINFQYDVCALTRLGGTAPPTLLATHEVMY